MRNNAGISILFAACAAVAKKQASPIEHVITLVMENRPFDHFFGFSQEEIGDLNGLTGDEFNYVDGESGDKTYVAKGSAQYVCANGPSQAFDATCTDWFGKEKGGFAARDRAPRARAGRVGLRVRQRPRRGDVAVLGGPGPDQDAARAGVRADGRVLLELRGPSTPNHLFIQTATAAGCTSTGATYHCDGSSFPQRTVYENLADAGLTWQYYYNDSAWNVRRPAVSRARARRGRSGNAPQRPSPRLTDVPRLLQRARGRGGRRDVRRVLRARVRAARSPNFAFILRAPGHELHDGRGEQRRPRVPRRWFALGEKLLKQTYEALRAGPG